MTARPPVDGPFDINPPRAMIDQVVTLIQRASAETAAEVRQARASAAQPRRLTRGTSTDGHSVVLLDGEQVAQVEIDTTASWIPTANQLEIAAELRAAFPVGAGGENDWPKLTSDLSDSSHRTNRGVNPPWEMSEA